MTSGVLFRPKEPQWLREVAQDSSVRARDIAGIFGFKTAGGVFSSVRSGAFPKPDGKANGYSRSSALWKVSTIRAEIKRRASLGGES